MTNGQIYALIVGAVVLFIIGKMIYDKLHRRSKFYAQLLREYGRVPDNDYKAGRYEGIGCYYKSREKKQDVVDDITWNDLDMETVFMIINNTQTGVGEEYLYAMLRMPTTDSKVLMERDRVARFFHEHEDERLKVQYVLKRLGKLRTASVSQYLESVRSLRPKSPMVHIVLCALLLIAIAGCFIRPVTYVPLLILIIVVNMAVYFWYKGKVGSYFVVFAYLARLTQTAADLAALKISALNDYNHRLEKNVRPLKKVGRNAWLFVSGTDFSADLISIVLDYIKMITHVDLIVFDRMVSCIYQYKDELDLLMDMIGELDSDIAIASYRAYMGDYCVPELTLQGKPFIKTENIYHPMVINPVKNSLDEAHCVLVTGSNASGKSTFLKTVAINAILAQTIYTCLADSYRSSYFRVYSSMALKDSIMDNESYYIVEIRSLKRILDASGDTVPMLCFIDEVLRGTNTVERIAASSRILAELSRKNTLCFAATHDIELATILQNHFSSYHFQEEIKDNDVLFDYMIHPGKAVSRNAIKLLDIIGFDPSITNEAAMAAKSFEKTGVWSQVSLV